MSRFLLILATIALALAGAHLYARHLARRLERWLHTPPDFV